MKFAKFLIICVFVFFSCKKKSDNLSYGKKIIADDAITARSMASHYKVMRQGDSINSKIKGRVKAVCKVKGCWMRVDLQDGSDVIVRFKDYGFFVPKDIEGKEIIFNGKAYVEDVSVETQKHYAIDAGKPKEHIELINKPQKTYFFEADGVLISQ